MKQLLKKLSKPLQSYKNARISTNNWLELPPKRTQGFVSATSGFNSERNSRLTRNNPWNRATHSQPKKNSRHSESIDTITSDPEYRTTTPGTSFRNRSSWWH